MTVPLGFICGALIGAALGGLGYVLHGEAPPAWLALLGTAIIFLPIAIWARLKDRR